MNLITITTFLPLLGAVALVLHGLFWGARGTDKAQLDNHYRWIALLITIVTFVVSLLILPGFDSSQAGPQMTQKVSWIGALGVSYFVGIDGLTIWLVILSTFLMPVAVLASWNVTKRVREYMVFLLILETGMLGVFVSFDMFLFYLFFPYNFIHARGDYSEFLPEAQRRQVGLIAMKPLASGSIVKLDPRVKMETAPEFPNIELWQQSNKPVLPAVVAELTKSLNRLPDETLCMAAMRFVYSRSFLSCAIAGMFEERCLDDNYRALERRRDLLKEEGAALKAAARYASALGPRWLPSHYRWLEDQWRA